MDGWATGQPAQSCGITGCFGIVFGSPDATMAGVVQEAHNVMVFYFCESKLNEHEDIFNEKKKYISDDLSFESFNCSLLIDIV